MSISQEEISCTWKDESNCIECSLDEKLICRYNKKQWQYYTSTIIPWILLEVGGLIFIGFLPGKWWPFIIYSGVTIAFFFLGIKSYVLCSHCPFYAEEGGILHCPANTGLPKFWKYRPEPMSVFEKIVLSTFFIFLFGWGIGWEIYGIYFLAKNLGFYGLYLIVILSFITLFTIATLVRYLVVLQKSFCSYCPNFSCPMNRISKKIVAEYLEKNPKIKEAWEKKGFVIIKPIKTTKKGEGQTDE
ncbi:MAG: hypothetical protein FK732_09935 [Asgard group archaeon]|nr:hypothetical protein [Asgard group archaeon]